MDDSNNPSDSYEFRSNATHGHENSGPNARKTRIPLGMDSFDTDAQQRFGQSVRLAMAFMDGVDIPLDNDAGGTADQGSDDNADYGQKQESEQAYGSSRTSRSEASAIAHRLKQLGRNQASGMAEQLELLVRFDELKGWESSGSRHCGAWMNLELGISMKLGWEYLRVGRKLRSLPITTALFRDGKLTWSTVRLISRVADGNSERVLCHAALDASVSDVERLCNEYRWQQDHAGGDAEQENMRSLQQIEARSFSWQTVSNGNTLIKLALPPEVAQAFLKSVEHALGQLEESEDTMTQRRADAAVLMAENSLQFSGRDMATADRYQVIVSVDAADLSKGAEPSSEDTASDMSEAPFDSSDTAIVDGLPSRRPIIQGAGPIARATARRIACDCSVSGVILSNGEPVDIGRKSRMWTPAMARSIKNRDQHCQFPGCTQTRHLQIHHIQHWADGGSTCVDNGVCLCSRHHTIVHEGGYRIERVDEQSDGLEEQFVRQQRAGGVHGEMEQALRNDRESFSQVQQLLSTRFRFRVVNRDGLDIRDVQGQDAEPAAESTHVESTHVESTHVESTHVESTCEHADHSSQTDSTYSDDTPFKQWWNDIQGDSGGDSNTSDTRDEYWPGVGEKMGVYEVVRCADEMRCSALSDYLQ